MKSEETITYGGLGKSGQSPEHLLEIAESQAVRSFHELRVFQMARHLQKDVFELSKRYPKEESYALTDQIRRSARSVAANISEAWHRRPYPAAFVEKLNQSEAEAAETQAWLLMALDCQYVLQADFERLTTLCEQLGKSLVGMQLHWESWTANVKRKPPK